MKYLYLVALLLFLPKGALPNEDRPPIPETTSITSVTGEEVQLATLAKKGKWLLFLVRANDPKSESLLSLIARAPELRQPSNLVIICGCSPRNLLKLASSFPEIPQGIWYGDAGLKVINDLKLSGIPGLVGLNNGKIIWTHNGVPDTPEKTKSMILSWTHSHMLILEPL